jgi:hypothetical protein
MRRRELITLLGAAAAWPLAARAQQPTLPVIGFLSGASQQSIAPLVAAFLKGLGATGYFEGRSIAIEYRWGADQLDRLPALTVELISRHVTALVCHSDLAIIAAKAETTTIPILSHGRRSRSGRFRREPQPAGWKPHRNGVSQRRFRAKAARAAA